MFLLREPLRKNTRYFIRSNQRVLNTYQSMACRRLVFNGRKWSWSRMTGEFVFSGDVQPHRHIRNCLFKTFKKIGGLSLPQMMGMPRMVITVPNSWFILNCPPPRQDRRLIFSVEPQPIYSCDAEGKVVGVFYPKADHLVVCGYQYGETAGSVLRKSCKALSSWLYFGCQFSCLEVAQLTHNYTGKTQYIL